MKERQQFGTTYVLPFTLVSALDHLSGASGLGSTPTVKYSKNGAAFAACSGAVAEVGGGDYCVQGAGLAFDLNTLGPLQLQISGSGADPADVLFSVVNYNPFDPFSTVLPVAPVANTVGEALVIADYLGGRTNTAQAGGASTITLDSGASSDAGAYVGDDIVLIGGTGGGVRGTGQRRTILSYNTGTKVATVNRPWDTNPDSTTKFMTFPVAKSDVWIWGGSADNLGVPATTSGVVTGIYTDVLSSSDFTTANSMGQLLKQTLSQASGVFTTSSSSIFTVSALQNGPVGSGAGGGGASVTAFWEDLLGGGDFGTTGSVGLKLATFLATPNVNVTQWGGTNVGGMPNSGKVAVSLATGDVTGNLTANVIQVAGQTAIAAGTVTFPGSIPTAAANATAAAAAILKTPAQLLVTDTNGAVLLPAAPTGYGATISGSGLTFNSALSQTDLANIGVIVSQQLTKSVQSTNSGSENGTIVDHSIYINSGGVITTAKR